MELDRFLICQAFVDKVVLGIYALPCLVMGPTLQLLKFFFFFVGCFNEKLLCRASAIKSLFHIFNVEFVLGERVSVIHA